MDLSELEYKRFQEAQNKGGSGEQEVERARVQFEASRIDWELAKIRLAMEGFRLEQLSARLDRLRLKAPFNGSIDAVLVDIGQVVSENEKVVRVVDISKIEMDVGAPTEDPRTWKLVLGDKAWILLDVAGSPRLVEGRVDEVAPTADLGSRSRRIRVVMDNPEGPGQLIAGEPAWVRFSEPPADVVELIRAAGTVARAAE
jgi:multidrug efflux pump subunit AcrA (membrane-fusion protein)